MGRLSIQNADQTQHQGHGLHGRGLKAVLLVKAFRALMERVDKDRSDPGVAGDRDGSLDGVLQQSWAELASL